MSRPACARHIRVRCATVRDIHAIAGIETSSFLFDRYSMRQLRYLLTQAKSLTLVAEQATEVIAFAMLLLPAGARPARLYSIAVHPGWRGQGIGSSLLRRCLRQCRKRGYTRLRLEVRRDDIAVVRLYEMLGFRSIDLLKGHYADGDDALRMQCEC